MDESSGPGRARVPCGAALCADELLPREARRSEPRPRLRSGGRGRSTPAEETDGHKPVVLACGRLLRSCGLAAAGEGRGEGGRSASCSGGDVRGTEVVRPGAVRQGASGDLFEDEGEASAGGEQKESAGRASCRSGLDLDELGAAAVAGTVLSRLRRSGPRRCSARGGAGARAMLVGDKLGADQEGPRRVRQFAVRLGQLARLGRSQKAGIDLRWLTSRMSSSILQVGAVWQAAY